VDSGNYIPAAKPPAGLDDVNCCVVGPTVVVNHGHTTTGLSLRDGHRLWEEAEGYIFERFAGGRIRSRVGAGQGWLGGPEGGLG